MAQRSTWPAKAARHAAAPIAGSSALDGSALLMNAAVSASPQSGMNTPSSPAARLPAAGGPSSTP